MVSRHAALSPLACASHRWATVLPTLVLTSHLLPTAAKPHRAYLHTPPAGTRQLRFLHPVANGRDPGGWMVEEKEQAGEGEGEA